MFNRKRSQAIFQTKKLTLALALLSLTSCVTTPQPALPVALQSQKVSVSAEPSELYYAAQQCVLDNISAPLTGQLFTFQSEKNESLAFVYSGSIAVPIGFTTGHRDFRGTIRFEGKTGIFKPQNVRVGLGRNNVVEHNAEANSRVNRMVKRLANCVPAYI